MQGFAVAFVLHRESQICCTNNKKGLNQQQKNRPPLIVSQTEKSIPSVKSVIDGYNILQSRFCIKVNEWHATCTRNGLTFEFHLESYFPNQFSATFVAVIEFIVPPLPPHHHDPHHNDPHHDVARPRYHRCQLLTIMLIIMIFIVTIPILKIFIILLAAPGTTGASSTSACPPPLVAGLKASLLQNSRFCLLLLVFSKLFV